MKIAAPWPDVPAADLDQFLHRLIADNEARAELRTADGEADFIERSLTLARAWSLAVTAEELQIAGRAAARRWLERML